MFIGDRPPRVNGVKNDKERSRDGAKRSPRGREQHGAEGSEIRRKDAQKCLNIYAIGPSGSDRDTNKCDAVAAGVNSIGLISSLPHVRRKR